LSWNKHPQASVLLGPSLDHKSGDVGSISGAEYRSVLKAQIGTRPMLMLQKLPEKRHRKAFAGT
jgi:hypothetical protein